nr:VOC family protein [Sphingomonas sp. Y57]
MRLSGVDGVILGVEDLDIAGRFYDDFGLDRLQSGHTGATFGTRDRTTIDLRRIDDNGLPPAVTGGSTIREVIWAAPDRATVDAVAAYLTRDRPVTIDSDGTLHSLDDDGYGIAFRVGRREAIEPAPNRLNIYGAPPSRPINSRIDFFEAIRPTSVAHVVVMTPDVDRAVAFYTERLGFRITDRFLNGQGAFLRPAGSPYHHALFLIRGAERGLHHIAFAVTDFNDVVLGGNSMLRAGWETRMGPGRHVIGSNYFWYFKSPCGGAMELTADMDRADDDWTVGEWEFVPENTKAWEMDIKPLPGNGPRLPNQR